jgi:hypothetical protein
MRKLGCFDLHGVTVDEVVAEFNERHNEFGITEETDIISISVRPATEPHKIAQPDGSLKESKVVVTIFYWQND